MKDWKRNKGRGRGGGGYAEQVKVSADQEEELGGHKDSFVSLAVALASTKKGKKTLEARGWMDDGLKAWPDVSQISLFVTVVSCRFTENAYMPSPTRESPSVYGVLQIKSSTDGTCFYD